MRVLLKNSTFTVFAFAGLVLQLIQLDSIRSGELAAIKDSVMRLEQSLLAGDSSISTAANQGWPLNYKTYNELKNLNDELIDRESASTMKLVSINP
jgi:hypothetical protein